MKDRPNETLRTPRRGDLGLAQIVNKSGLSISLLPNGAIFALEHVREGQRIMVNQSFGSPLAGGMGGMFLRIGGSEPIQLPVAGGAARCRIGTAEDRFVWTQKTLDVSHSVSLWLHPDGNIWLWRLEVVNNRAQPLACDAVFIQDLGLGEPDFLMSNEAFACQYLDHHIAPHPRIGPVLMSRQNLPQDDRHPWIAHGCLEGAVGFATDFCQLMGPSHRDADGFDMKFGMDLPSSRLQHEAACAALQSKALVLAPGAAAGWTFFGCFEPDHRAASTDADLARIDEIEQASNEWQARAIETVSSARSFLQDAPVAVADCLDEAAIEKRYPRRLHDERLDGRLLSFFTPGETHARHVVLRDKERIVLRRHGALLRSGEDMLPSEAILCATFWMHGVFGAQLTIGNTSFHQLFSVSRDPYNLNRGSGLRLLVDAGDGWRLLTVPSAFEIGLGDCRWIYRLGARTVTVTAVVSGEEPAVQWRVSVEGEACRFLVFGHLVLGENEFSHAGRVEIDARQKRSSFRPDPDDRWSRAHPKAVYHLVTSTPESIEIVGADELLYRDGERRGGGYAAFRTLPTKDFAFAIVGSMSDPNHAQSLAAKYASPVGEAAMLSHATQFWRRVTRGIRVETSDGDAGAQAIDTIFAWLVHDAMVHLTVPRGLEQHTGAAWGTRDVCQGPMELFLSLEHDEPAKAILRIVFAQQYVTKGDWPQWFMLEPYSEVQDSQAHGDVVIWPLKALCDYVEATGDFAFLDEPIAWRREDDLQKTADRDPVLAHLDKLIATVRERFIAGTVLIRYGNGDWNDSLQPVDPAKRDWMVSSWTVALLYQQLRRYAEILRRSGRSDAAAEQESLAAAMRADFNQYLMRDGTVAGYAVFGPEGGLPELMLHPSDHRTGLSYSLLPMTQAIIGGLFTPEQAEHHLGLVRKHLAFADGVRLMDRPIAYHGGPQRIFQRAESAAFFGREIGLMYVHSHLRQAEAMAALGEAQALWDALLVVNPIAVTDLLAHASLRQRNTYFSSSDAAFRDRYQASAEWERVRHKTIAVAGGWRVYSSGSGLYTNMLVRHAFGVTRHFGARIVEPCLPASPRGLRLAWPGRPAPGSPPP